MPSLFEDATPHADGYREISPARLAHTPAKPRLIDVREPSEYAGELGHVEGAELVPLATLGSAASSWPREEPIVVICRSGARSGRAAAQLVKMGFAKVMNLTGGMLAWNGAALPIVRA